MGVPNNIMAVSQELAKIAAKNYKDAEKDIIEAFKEFNRQHPEASLKAGASIVRINADSYYRYWKPAAKECEVDFTSITHLRDGSVAIIYPATQEEQVRQALQYTETARQAFCVSQDELRQHAGGSKITTRNLEALSRITFKVLPELTMAKVPYCLNKDGSISYPENKEYDVQKALNKAAAETATMDYRFEQKVNELKEKACFNFQNLEDGETIFIASSHKQNDKSGRYLKVTKEGYQDITYENGKIVAGELLHLNLEQLFNEGGPEARDAAIAKLAVKLDEYFAPVILTEAEFNVVHEERIDTVSNRTIVNYGGKYLYTEDRNYMSPGTPVDRAINKALRRAANVYLTGTEAPKEAWDKIENELLKQGRLPEILKTVDNEDIYPQVGAYLKLRAYIKDKVLTQEFDIGDQAMRR